jgi:zinc transport system substrate-binding protein
MLQHYIRFLLAVLAIFTGSTLALANIKVVATIKPIHSIAAAVMQGAGVPELLLKGSASPHTYALTPHDAQSLQDATIIFWVGPELETFLVKPLATLAEKAAANPLLHAKGLQTLVVREDHGEIDPHIWLDPRNTAVIADAMAETLATVDPANAALYKKNAGDLKLKLAALETEIASSLGGVKTKPVIVMHDAYQYFEKRFGLPASMALSIHPENPQGVATLRNIREVLQLKKASCIFTEPQFNARLVATVTEGLETKTAELDPLGATLPEGPDMYFELLLNLSAQWHWCLAF